jgi:hypothetical protein
MAHDIRVCEYESAEGKVFSVFSKGQLFKSCSTAGNAACTWKSGSGRELRPDEVNRLEEIRKNPKHFRRVRRFPRMATAAEQPTVTPEPFDSCEASLSWETIPQFDPSVAQKTRWVVGSFLAEGNIQLVFGERGAFKSTLFLAMARAVAAGEAFLGMKTRRRRVLYLDYENPANVIRARSDDLGFELPDDHFKLWDRFRRRSPKPGDPELEEIVMDCKAKTGHGPWLIFDSWSSLLNPGEGGELTGQTAYKFVELRRLADLGATITVIDHTRKYDRSTIYGGQDKEAKADSIHNLQLYDENRAHPVVVVKSWLKRHAPKNDGTFAFEVRGEQDQKGNWHILKILRVENPEAEQERRHIELLRSIIRANPHAGQEEIAKLAAEQGLARDAAIKLLKAGAGKYWTRETIGHNKFRYRVK